MPDIRNVPEFRMIVVVCSMISMDVIPVVNWASPTKSTSALYISSALTALSCID